MTKAAPVRMFTMAMIPYMRTFHSKCVDVGSMVLLVWMSGVDWARSDFAQRDDYAYENRQKKMSGNIIKVYECIRSA